MKANNTSFMSTDQFLDHWQGHRRLTRRVIEAFPEEQLYTFSIGGMRPMSELVRELITLAADGVKGMVTNQWESYEVAAARPFPGTKSQLLSRWDEVTGEINEHWPLIPKTRFGEVITTFGQYEGPVYSSILYWIDNEIHHRGQGYVYLRALGIEPPGFWMRG